MDPRILTRLPRVLLLLLLLLMGGMTATRVQAQGAGEDITGVIEKAQVDDTPQEFVDLLNTMRGIAVVLLLIALVGAAMMATWGNTKMAMMVAGGAVFLFGAFWIIGLIAESMQAQDTLPTLTAITVTDSPMTTEGGPAGPIKDALNEGLNILTTITLPFILIYGLWLSLAVAAGEADAPVMRGYVVGSIVALSASILAQAFKII